MVIDSQIRSASKIILQQVVHRSIMRMAGNGIIRKTLPNAYYRAAGRLKVFKTRGAIG